MILTVGLNPIIETYIELDSIAVGMKHKALSKRTFVAAKSFNVAVGLSRLNCDVLATGFLFEGLGEVFEHELHRQNVNYRFIRCKGNVSTSYKLIDSRSMMTEIFDEGDEIPADKQDDLLRFIKEQSNNCEAVILSGDLAKGLNFDYFAKILSVISPNAIKVVDAAGELLLKCLPYGVDLIKPNLAELSATLKKDIYTRAQMLDGCKQLIDMGAKNVLLSLGKDGAILCNREGSYYCKSSSVAMNSTMGAGDSMLAAATISLCRGEKMEKVLLSGVAAGTAAVTSPLSISFEKEKYLEILSSLNVEKL